MMSLRCAAAAFVVLLAPMTAAAQTVLTVNTEAQLRDAIFQASNDLAVDGVVDNGPYTITITASITLTQPLPMIRTNAPATGGAGITIEGSDASVAVDGAGAHRVFFVTDGRVLIQNLTIDHARATGGKGGDSNTSFGGGGGGGLGAGGAVFVDEGADVTLRNVSIGDASAAGGAGGNSLGSGGRTGSGGGGGLGGDGGSTTSGGSGGGGGYAGSGGFVVDDPSPTGSQGAGSGGGGGEFGTGGGGGSLSGGGGGGQKGAGGTGAPGSFDNGGGGGGGRTNPGANGVVNSGGGGGLPEGGSGGDANQDGTAAPAPFGGGGGGGGHRKGGAGQSSGGGGGGATGTPSNGPGGEGGTGGGGGGGSSTNGGNGGRFGGGGGAGNGSGLTGGTSQFGGGGGGVPAGLGNVGGAGGFGGGGGAGGETRGAAGEFGGQGGASGLLGADGGGGAGLGGVFFNGGTLTLDNITFSGSYSVAGGTTPGGGGAAAGQALGALGFLMDGTTTTMNVSTGFNLINSEVAGGGGLTKAGAGTLILVGNNTYTGPTTVNDGLLEAEGSLAGPIVVNGGTLMPGGDVTPVLNSGSVTVNPGGTMRSAFTSFSYTQLKVTGTVTLGGALDILVVDPPSPLPQFTPLPGQTFTIIDNDGSDPVTGTFAGRLEGSTFALASAVARITYHGGDGNDVVIGIVSFPTLSGIASTGVAFGGAIHDTATIAGGAAPTGTVTFSLYGPGDATCGGAPVFTETRPVAGAGVYISSSLTPAAAGVYRWVTVYSGDLMNDPASNVCNAPNQNVTIAKGNQTITIDPVSGKTFGQAPFPVSATSTSSLAVTAFSSLTTGVCTVASSTVMIVGAGTCTLAANQAGDGNYNPATQATLNVTVAKAGQTVAIDPIGAKVLGGAPFGVSATATSLLPVTAFSSQTTGVCTVAGSTVTTIAVGTCTIAADQGGNANFFAAPQVTQSFSVVADCSQTAVGPALLPLGLVAVPYSQTLTLGGAALPATFTLAGTLPPGVTFNNGVLSGTPAVLGAFPIAVTGTDVHGCQATASYDLAISAERHFLVGAGAGGPALIRAFTGASATIAAEVTALDAFTGGVSVAQGDVDGNGVAEMIAGTGPGGSPRVTVIDGGTHAPRLSFLAFEAGYRGGVEVAAGDITGDGLPEILVVGGCAAPPVVRAFNGITGALVREYPVSAPVWSCGLHVAAGDTNGDGVADIIVGSGGIGSPFVQVIDGASGAALRTIVPYDPGFTGGVYVAAADVTGDGRADIVTGAGPGGGPHVRVFDGATGLAVAGPLGFGGFFAYAPAFSGGVRVAAGDLDGDGHAEIMTGAGPGGGPHVRVFNGATGLETFGILAFDPAFAGGTFLAGPPVTGRMAIDIAAATGTQVRVAGWALREGLGDTAGTDAIHAWAFPVGGGTPVFVGSATTRGGRADVAAAFGGEFLRAGFDITGTLAPGTYDLVVYARNSKTLLFDQARAVRITVH